jgi:hypothetical protein
MSLSSSRSSLTPLEDMHTKIIFLTKYFDVDDIENNKDKNKLDELEENCATLLQIIKKTQDAEPAKPHDTFELIDLLKMSGENTIEYIQNFKAANATYQEISQTKKVESGGMKNFFDSIRFAVDAYNTCISLTSKNNFLTIRFLAAFKDVLLGKNIQLELLSRGCLLQYYGYATKKDATDDIKKYLQGIIDCNTHILRYIQKSDAKKYVAEKKETEALQQDCQRTLMKLQYPPSSSPIFAAPKPQKAPFFDKSSPSSSVSGVQAEPDSLDQLLKLMSVSNTPKKPSSKK